MFQSMTDYYINQEILRNFVNVKNVSQFVKDETTYLSIVFLIGYNIFCVY